MLVLTLVGSMLLAFLAPRPSLLRSPALERVFLGILTVAVAVRASTVSFFLASLSVAGLMVAWAFSSAPPLLRANSSPPGRARAAWVVLAQSATLAWGVWITTFTRPLEVTMGLSLAVAIFSAIRVARWSRLREEAWSGLPFSFLPLAGLLREPSLAFVALALVAYAARRTRWVGRIASARRTTTSAVSAGWSLLAIATIPHQFRDLGHLNWFNHEAGQFAWTNSIFHGRLMLADAGTLYGPLRQYTVALFAALFGVTAENVRLAQVLVNLSALGILASLVYRLARGRVAIFAWGLFLLLAGTYAALWMDYVHTFSFGWADLGRAVFPLAALMGALAATRGAPGEDRRAARCALAGVGLGLGLLYAQEFGACAIGAAGVAAAVVALTDRGQGSLKERARDGVSALLPLALGALAPSLLFVLIYVALGRGPLLLRTATLSLSLFGSGQYGALASPVTRTSFDSTARILTGEYVRPLEIGIPLFVYAVTLANLARAAMARRWSREATIRAALLAYGVASAKVALGRTDLPHLLSSTIPAALLVVSLTEEATRSALGLASLARRGVVLSLVLASTQLHTVEKFMRPRLRGLIHGSEVPSRGPPHVHPDIPRAGDVNIDAAHLSVVRFIRASSSPHDTISSTEDFTLSSEVYFLSDRANATRFDLPCEMATFELRDEALASLKEKRPKVVFGSFEPMLGDAYLRYLAAHYEVRGEFSGIKVAVRRDGQP